MFNSNYLCLYFNFLSKGLNMQCFKDEMFKQKEAEMKAMGCQYASWNPSDLVYLFEPIEAVQIQQILYALQNGYVLESITNGKGVVKFVLSYKKDK